MACPGNLNEPGITRTGGSSRGMPGPSEPSRVVRARQLELARHLADSSPKTRKQDLRRGSCGPCQCHWQDGVVHWHRATDRDRPEPRVRRVYSDSETPSLVTQAQAPEPHRFVARAPPAPGHRRSLRLKLVQCRPAQANPNQQRDQSIPAGARQRYVRGQCRRAAVHAVRSGAPRCACLNTGLESGWGARWA